MKNKIINTLYDYADSYNQVDAKNFYNVAVNIINNLDEHYSLVSVDELNLKIVELETKIQVYEEIIKKSNFAPMIEKGNEERRK